MSRVNTHALDSHSGGSMLAESENVSVFRCSCGAVHLQIGPVRLTMLLHELTEVASVLLHALDHVRRADAPQTSAIN